MDFTREPIIETVITPREGYRLVVRSSKGAGSEEHFVDALEVVSFGSGVFFRSLERPKPFIVPVADYEVLEVREPRMVLKTLGPEGAKHKLRAEQPPREQREPKEPKAVKEPKEKPEGEQVQAQEAAPGQPQEGRPERAQDRRRDRRRGFRRRRGQGRDEAGRPEGEQEATGVAELPQEGQGTLEEGNMPSSTPMLSSILPPPTKLIRDDLKRLREDYKGAFYTNEESQDDLAPLGTTSEDEFSFRETPYDVTEADIRMSEGGDVEVSQEEPFCPPAIKEEANSGTTQDA